MLSPSLALTRRAAAVLAVAWAGALVACGGGAPMASSAKSDASDDLESELARAEGTIYGKLTGGAGYPASPSGPGTSVPGPSPGPAGPEATTPTPPGPGPSPAPPTDAARPNAGSSGDEAAREDDACDTACDALASMQRAVERICSIAGTESDRCKRAQERLARAQETVTSQCEECGS